MSNGVLESCVRLGIVLLRLHRVLFVILGVMSVRIPYRVLCCEPLGGAECVSASCHSYIVQSVCD